MTGDRPALDGRLLVPAGAAWLGAALARGAAAAAPPGLDGHTFALALAGSAVVLLVALVGLGLVRLRTRRCGPTATVVSLAAGFGLLGIAAAAIGAAVLTAPPVGDWMAVRATAVVRGVVTTEPRTLTVRSGPTWRQGERIEQRLATSSVSARGVEVAVETPLVLVLPDSASAVPPGTSVEVAGRLGPLPRQSDAGGSLTVRTLSVLGGPGPIDVAAHAMRVGLRAALDGTPADGGALVAGLAVGDDSLQSPELAADMRTSGLSHLTAVSGGNVSIVLAVVLALATAMRLPLAARVVTALGSLGFFAILVGAQPSVLRACAMGAVTVVGLLAGGRRAGPSVLGGGVLLLVILAPWLATSWAFALSACATAGLILLTPTLADRLAHGRRTRRWPPAVQGALALTAAAQIATLPILVAMGGTVGWVALPANLVVMPVVPVVTVLGLLAAVVAPVAGWPAWVLAHAAAWPAAWIALVAHLGARLPMARLPWPVGWPGLGLLAAIAISLAVGVHVRRRLLPGGLSTSVRVATAAALVVVGGVGLARPPSRQGWPPPGWFMIMCDVGQGDALLLRAGDGAAVVVDTGPDPDVVDRCLTDAGIETIPAVVLTHFHADHVDGLAGVLLNRPVGAVLADPIREPIDEAMAVDRTLGALGLAVTPIAAGDVRVVGDVSWRAVWPRRRIAAGSVPNNASVVLIASVAGHDVLLTGDIEPEAQQALAADLRGRSFDVVKVPHHGSRYQAVGLTEWAPAGVALISVGAGNDYGHPAPETITAWEGSGARVMRTDRDGDVAVVAVGPDVGVVTRHGP